MKRHYYFVSDNCDPLLFATKKEAIAFAKKIGASEVTRIRVTSDAVIRLHNGGGGYVEEEQVIWTNGTNAS